MGRPHPARVGPPRSPLIAYDAGVDPYRTLAVDELPEAPRDPGIVGDVIRQFADPKAFYRELVQNAIDAGSPSVEIRIEHDRAAQKLRVAVRDRGEGMSRDTLENQLLVLFRSTKESDPTKIGKFGIGFASVLAPEPEVVIVQSVRDGRRLTLHLFRDLTYELFDGGPATHAGTWVELVVAIPDAEVEAFVKASMQALVRWCRHASVPIELTWVPADGAVQTTRIDRPLAIEDAIVQVIERSPDGHLVAAVGITPELAPYTGFFNHGLTLYETRDAVAGEVAAKIQDSRLGHTLSRDNVRRDEAYDRAVGFARTLATQKLPRALEAELRAAAEARDLGRYRVIANAVIASRATIAWSLPLAAALGGVWSVAGTDLPKRVWVSAGSSRLAARVMAAGTPVLDESITDIAGLPALLAAQYGCKTAQLEAELTAVTHLEPSSADTALIELLRALFDTAGRVPAAIVLATLEGARGEALAISGDRDAAPSVPYLLEHAATNHNPFTARLRKPALVISTQHRFVAMARAGDPRLAASHLARAILLEYGMLDVAASQRLLDHTLDALG